jgi:hypothetical protein
MILVDTSVWVQHLRAEVGDLAGLLNEVQVACHPFIIGELACGHLRHRSEILHLLGELPQVVVAEHGDALALVESRRLMGIGIGWVDVHLLASALLSGTPLWTIDERLLQAARRLGVGFVRS